MYTLYIDSHFNNLVIALLKDGKIKEEKIIESGKHSEIIINLIKEVLEDNKLEVADLKEIIVINGPGSFTGVRIGVVIAKIMGYTKNILLKPISFLQAASLDYDKNITLGIEDRNGVFIGSFNQEHELVGDYKYLNNKEKDSYKEKIVIVENKIKIEKVWEFLKDKPPINPHELTPLYVKKIEVQNG